MSKETRDAVVKEIFKMAKEQGNKIISFVENERDFILLEKEGKYKPFEVMPLARAISNEIGTSLSKYDLKELVFDVATKSLINFDMDFLIMPRHIIQFQNGMFDVELMEWVTGLKVIPRFIIPVDYNPDAKCPKIEKFLLEIVSKGDVILLKELAGYLLLSTDYRYSKCFILTGTGANGKSVFLNLMKNFLGEDNVDNLQFQELGINFRTKRLEHMLANMCADIPHKAIDYTGVFKALTGGDSVSCDVKHQEGVKFTSVAKFIFGCNQIPKSYDESFAYYRRFFIIDFPNTFSGDDEVIDLISQLSTPDELSGLLNIALDSLKKIKAEGFSKVQSQENVRERMIMKSQPLKYFCTNLIFEEQGNKVELEELYSKYTEWCTDNNLNICDINWFSRNLGRFLPFMRSRSTSKDGVRKREYLNIKYGVESKIPDGVWN